MGSATMGWQAMGKPDFSQCAKLFYRLPVELRESLNRSEEKVLIWGIFLSWTTAFRSGRQTTIASFSETWMGQRFGKSRWTVGRALAKLEGWSLLKRIRRNPRKDGTFQTNLIALSGYLTALIAPRSRHPRSNLTAQSATTGMPISAKSTQVPDKSPCSKTAPQGTKSVYKREKTATFDQSASHSSSLSALQLREMNDATSQEEENPKEKGFLVKLFLQMKAEKGRSIGGPSEIQA